MKIIKYNKNKKELICDNINKKNGSLIVNMLNEKEKEIKYYLVDNLYFLNKDELYKMRAYCRNHNCDECEYIKRCCEIEKKIVKELDNDISNWPCYWDNADIDYFLENYNRGDVLDEHKHKESIIHNE